MCMVTFDSYPGKITLRKDTIKRADDAVVFYHRVDGRSFLFDYTVKQQQLEAVRDQLWNPLEDLTWGGVMLGEGYSSAGETTGRYASTAYKGWRITSDEARAWAGQSSDYVLSSGA